MNLHRVKENQSLSWPTCFTEIPETSTLTRLGRERYKTKHRVLRAKAGFVIDMDSPGELFFCGDHNGVLVAVPQGELDTAEEAIEKQGAIDFQPALDWLESQGLLEKKARPEPKAEESRPVGKLQKLDLRVICDALQIKHASAKNMRVDIMAALQCDATDVVRVDEQGDVVIEAS